jgi:predicted small metal-binding protein
MAKEFTCELDGFVMRAETDEELVAHVERHIAEAHGDLVGKLSRDDIRVKVAAEARTTAGATSRPVPR